MASNARRHSGFAQFSSEAARREFAKRVFGQVPELEACAYMAGSRPEIVFENLDDGQLALVQEALSSHGVWHDDVQFEAMN